MTKLWLAKRQGSFWFFFKNPKRLKSFHGNGVKYLLPWGAKEAFFPDIKRLGEGKFLQLNLELVEIWELPNVDDKAPNKK